MAITNPTKYVSVQRLGRFEEQLGQKYATKTANSGKADKVSGATNNNFAALNSNGNLKDSGYKPSDFAAANHNHNSSYYTKSETDTKYATKEYVNSKVWVQYIPSQRSIVFPDGMRATYSQANRSVWMPGVIT